MDRNSMEFQELEELRGQVSLLKEKLLRQQIISEQAITAAAQKGIGRLNRSGVIYSVLGVLTVVYSPWVFRNIGFSDSFVIGTAIFLGVCVLVTIYAHFGLMSVDVTRGNLVDIAQRLVRFRKIYSHWHLVAVPALLVWCYCFYRDAQRMLNDAEGFLIAAVVGGVIGGVIGLTQHFKTLREADKVIANINDLMQHEE